MNLETLFIGTQVRLIGSCSNDRCGIITAVDTEMGTDFYTVEDVLTGDVIGTTFESSDLERIS